MQVGVSGRCISLVEKYIRERKRDMAVACINIGMARSRPCQAQMEKEMCLVVNVGRPCGYAVDVLPHWVLW
jgi:hypothetical protein